MRTHRRTNYHARIPKNEQSYRKSRKTMEEIKELTRRLYDKRESYIQIKVMFDTDFIVI